MSGELANLDVETLAIEERLTLIERLWASICTTPGALPLSDAQRAELDRRIAEDDRIPDDVVPWSEVKASVRQRLRG